jgi:hypothetical protein
MQVRIAKRRPGGKRKLALVAKIAGIGFIGSKDFVENFRHDALLKAGSKPNARSTRVNVRRADPALP